jgi:hypothetical protein
MARFPKNDDRWDPLGDGRNHTTVRQNRWMSRMQANCRSDGQQFVWRREQNHTGIG